MAQRHVHIAPTVIIILVSFIGIIGTGAVMAATIHVNAVGKDATATGSAAAPYADLQLAIDRAVDGDTLYLHPGRYSAEPDTFTEALCGNCENHKTEVKASRGFYIHNKALYLIGLERDSVVLVTNAGYGVFFENSHGSLITGVTITGGQRDADGAATDAGVVARYSTVTITDCSIKDNTHRPDSIVVGVGGVFGRENSELYIIGNTIANNGWDGIALYRGASAVITDNIIRTGRGAGIGITWDAIATVYRNRVSGYWKGIGTFGATRAVVRNNLVFDNLGWGIIATGTSYMDCANNVVYHNGNCGFGLWSPQATGRVTNCVFAANGWREMWVCPCVGVWNNGYPFLFPFSHNIIWDNKDGAFEGMPDLIDVDGNLAVDPLFVDEIEFVPSSISPMIDAGNSELTDPDGSNSDIGLYGGPNAEWPIMIEKIDTIETPEE
ncbi:right-handed parallel beta-helix repeat-containing protein [Candidatus Zixiibacteriota bacterium]